MKRSIFTLVFAFVAIAITIGSTVPDSPTLDPTELVMETPIKEKRIVVVGADYVDRTALAMIAVEYDINLIVVDGKETPAPKSTIDELRSNESFKISKTELDDDIDLFEQKIPIECLLHEEIKQGFKPYRMPRYDYKPSIKPPRIALHRS